MRDNPNSASSYGPLDEGSTLDERVERAVKARAEGAASFAAGKDWAADPYPENSSDYVYWLRGWSDAALDARGGTVPGALDE